MYVIYNKTSTAIKEIVRYRPYKVTASYKSEAAAKAAITRLSKAAQEQADYNIDKDPQFVLSIAEAQFYFDNIEKQVTRTGIMPGTGKESTITMSVNKVGGCTDPFTETYWSM